jgi:hypothetical protein
VSAAISLVLRRLGKVPDPARSREHVLLSVLAERRMQLGQTAELATLLDEVLAHPVERLGALDVDDFLPLHERRSLAAALKTLLASPTFASWRTRAACWARGGCAHWWCSTSVTGCCRPTKRPSVALMKQGRSFDVGVFIATQNRMDLDYRTLSNAGLCAVGRLQTDADRERMIESLANANEPGSTEAELSTLIRRLGPLWFPCAVHAAPNTVLLQPRWALSYLRGPMTLGDIRRVSAPGGGR